MAKKTQIPLDDSPEFAAALGRLSGHWATVEWELSGLLAGLLGVDSTRAALAYETFFNLAEPISLLERLASTLLQPSTERSALLKLMREAAELDRQRQGYLQAAWAVGRGGDSLQQVGGSVPRTPGALRRAMREVRVSEIDGISERIAALSAGLQWFSFESLSKLAIRSDPVPSGAK